MTLAELRTTLKGWLGNILPAKTIDDHILTDAEYQKWNEGRVTVIHTEEDPPDMPVDEALHVILITEMNHYHIKATRHGLGCVVSSRRLYPGETWHRGNDLSDGGLHEVTWLEIRDDILRYELQTMTGAAITYFRGQPIPEVEGTNAE